MAGAGMCQLTHDGIVAKDRQPTELGHGNNIN
jgi:hypothetical protein